MGDKQKDGELDLSKKNNFKCPFCNRSYVDKEYLYAHMDNEHHEQLNNLSPAHVFFNHRYRKTKGKCIMCGKETKFNEENERYDRLCSTKCSDDYREMFRQRMLKRYNKTHLLNDYKQQEKMQANRRISGEYRWSDGTKKTYMGSYEKHALEFLDKELGMESKNVITPSQIAIPYRHDGKERFYMPDIYLVSYNLLVEVKGTNNHYQKRDRNIERAKDQAAIKSEYNYVKVLDKKYDPLLNMIDKIKNI